MRDNQIAAGAILSYVGTGVGAINVLVVTPWAISVLGVREYGLYTLALTLVGLFTIDLGLGEAIARFLSRYQVTQNISAERSLAAVAVRLYLAIDALITVGFIVVFLSLHHVYGGLTSEELDLFRVAFIIVALYTVVAFPLFPIDGVLIAHERFAALRGMELFQRVLVLTLTVTALFLELGLMALIAAYVVGGLVTWLGKVLFALPLLPPRPWPTVGAIAMSRTLLGFSVWIGLSGLLNRMIMGLAPSLLAAWSNASEVGLFGVGAALEGYVYMIAAALNGLFLPRVTRLLSGEAGQSRVTDLMIRVGRIQLAIVGIAVVVIVVFGDTFIGLWVGNDFAASYAIAIILILPSLVSLPQQLGRTAVIAGGAVKAQTLVYFASLLVFFAAGALLVPRFGASGAASAVCLAGVARLIGVNILYSRLGLQVTRFFVSTYTRILPILVFGLVAGAVLKRINDSASWTGLATNLGLLLIFLVPLLWYAGFPADERQALTGVWSRNPREQ